MWLPKFRRSCTSRASCRRTVRRRTPATGNASWRRGYASGEPLERRDLLSITPLEFQTVEPLGSLMAVTSTAADISVADETDDYTFEGQFEEKYSLVVFPTPGLAGC